MTTPSLPEDAVLGALYKHNTENVEYVETKAQYSKLTIEALNPLCEVHIIRPNTTGSTSNFSFFCCKQQTQPKTVYIHKKLVSKVIKEKWKVIIDKALEEEKKRLDNEKNEKEAEASKQYIDKMHNYHQNTVNEQAITTDIPKTST